MSENRRPRTPTPAKTGPTPKRIFDLLGGDRKWDVKLTDALGRYFTVTSIDATRYQSKDLALCGVTIEGKPLTMLINSKTISEQLMEHKESFPLVCKVDRQGKRYRFVA